MLILVNVNVILKPSKWMFRSYLVKSHILWDSSMATRLSLQLPWKLHVIFKDSAISPHSRFHINWPWFYFIFGFFPNFSSNLVLANSYGSIIWSWEGSLKEKANIGCIWTLYFIPSRLNLLYCFLLEYYNYLILNILWSLLAHMHATLSP